MRANRASPASATFPAARKRRTNAGAFLGAFLGREGEVSKLERALESGARLVTLLGPPGMGKTRLAQRWLELHAAEYERWGGAWFVDLANVGDARGLAHAVAAVVPTWPDAAPVGPDAAAELGDALANAGPTALVLDNFEQLVRAGELVRRWCQLAPELHVIVTSRERLAIEGEHVIELPPLTCPRAGASDDEVLACDAVRLLSLRAEAAGGAIDGDPGALGELVRQLDGIPLAIELAAARTRVLRPKELAQRLKQLLLAPSPESARGEHRHATLASAIAWSWDLLAPNEQRALASLSVFAGSFAIDAADDVLSRDDEGADGAAALLAALRDKSLVHTTEGGRLALYVSIREYAGARLEERPDDARAARLRHVEHYARAAKAFNEARTFQGASPDHELRAELTRDCPNLVAALARASNETAEAPSLVAELALALTLLQAAPATSCLDALASALAALDPARADHRAIRARVLLSKQGLDNALGRFEDGRADLDALLAIDDLPAGMRVLGLVMKGIQLRYQGLAREAWQCHVDAARELDASGGGPLRLRAMNTACMGRLMWDLGDEAASREHNERARAICVEMGDPWLEGLPLANVAQMEQELGRFDVAAALLDRAHACFRAASEPHYTAVYAIAYGDLLFESERLEDARRWYGSAAGFFRGWLAHRQNAQLEAAWGALEARVGDLADAEEHLAQARRSAERGKSPLLRLLVELFDAQVTLVKLAKDPAALARERAALHERVRALRDPDDASPDAVLVRTSFDVRFALRMLERALAREAPPAEPHAPRGAGLALAVAPTGEWFALGGGERVDLARRASLKRILRTLTERHRAARGAGASRDALLASGWPDERLHPEAASKRLRVAIATLRSLGLRDVLRTTEDGYRFDPETRLHDDV